MYTNYEYFISNLGYVKKYIKDINNNKIIYHDNNIIYYFIIII